MSAPVVACLGSSRDYSAGFRSFAVRLDGQKSSRAVTEIVSELGLNIPVLHGPVQAVLQEHEFDTLVCRAVAPITKLLFWLKPCWDQFQQVLLIKGPAWKEELAVARGKAANQICACRGSC